MNTFYFRHNNAIQSAPAIACARINYNDLTFVLKGSLKYEINGQAIKVSAGDCIFIQQGSNRIRESSEPCEYISFNFYSHPQFLLPVYMENAISRDVKLLLGVCDEIYAKYNDWFNKIDKALELLLKLLADKLSSLEENPTIVTIKRYIRQNLKSKLALSEIANHVGYSPNHCDTIFKKETGDSIINYLISERISEAKRLLDEGVLTLKSIAEAVGFEDYNYFSRTFKKITGTTPTEYKSLNNI